MDSEDIRLVAVAVVAILVPVLTVWLLKRPAVLNQVLIQRSRSEADLVGERQDRLDEADERLHQRLEARMDSLEEHLAAALTRAENAEASAASLTHRVEEVESLLRDTQARYLRLQGEHDALRLKHDQLQTEHNALLLRVAHG